MDTCINFHVLLQVSKACTSICLWVRAMHKYNFVAKGVAPKRVSRRIDFPFFHNTVIPFIGQTGRGQGITRRNSTSLK